MTRRQRPDVTQLGSGSSGHASQRSLAGSGASGMAGVVSGATEALLRLSERQFQALVRAALEERRFVCWVVPNMTLTTAGLPDILAWHERLPGLLLCLELKREKDFRVTPKQTAALAHLETVPGIESRILRPSEWPALRDALDVMLASVGQRALTIEAREV